MPVGGRGGREEVSGSVRLLPRSTAQRVCANSLSSRCVDTHLFDSCPNSSKVGKSTGTVLSFTLESQWRFSPERVIDPGSLASCAGTERTIATLRYFLKPGFPVFRLYTPILQQAVVQRDSSSVFRRDQISLEPRGHTSMLRPCAPLGPIIERWTNSQLLLAEVLNLA